jgi:hypothetical protein
MNQRELLADGTQTSSDATGLPHNGNAKSRYFEMSRYLLLYVAAMISHKFDQAFSESQAANRYNNSVCIQYTTRKYHLE